MGSLLVQQLSQCREDFTSMCGVNALFRCYLYPGAPTCEDVTMREPIGLDLLRVQEGGLELGASS